MAAGMGKARRLGQAGAGSLEGVHRQNPGQRHGAVRAGRAVAGRDRFAIIVDEDYGDLAVVAKLDRVGAMYCCVSSLCGAGDRDRGDQQKNQDAIRNVHAAFSYAGEVRTLTKIRRLGRCRLQIRGKNRK
ncbi:MAG: hypothetical protein R3E47_15270 [Paracoccaceae bacterium]